MITAEELRQLLDYNPETGVFTWNQVDKFSVATYVGAEAGCVWTDGYRVIVVKGQRYLAHRLAWLYVYGMWPHGSLDHINRQKDANRISNLREATARENALNTEAGRSGLRGATWHSQRKKWASQLWHQGKRIFLGLYTDPMDAHLHYQWARISYDRSYF